MADVLIDYRFETTAVANPNGSLPLTLTGTAVVPGALDVLNDGKVSATTSFAGSGRADVGLGRLARNHERFCVQLVMQPPKSVTARQTLVECDLLPFAVHVEPGRSPDWFVTTVSLGTVAHGVREVTTRFASQHLVRAWHTVTFAFDLDTLVLIVDGVPSAVQAFPDGRIPSVSSAGRLRFGAALRGEPRQFLGSIAQFVWQNDIPPMIESQLDEFRTRPEWFLSRKLLHGGIEAAVGGQIGAVAFDGVSQSYVRQHERGALMYQDGVGAAFAISGPLHACYLALTNRAELGALASDELAVEGRPGRMNRFIRGGIYWSAPTGAAAVVGRMHVALEDQGGASAVGLPLGPAKAISGGIEQTFELGVVLKRTNVWNAYVVMAAMYRHFVAKGGIGTCGFPTSHEAPVMASGVQVGTTMSFEKGAIFVSSQGVVYFLNKDFASAYGDAGTELGFPTSEMLPIPGFTGMGGLVTFERGTIVWFGTRSDTHVVWPFRVRIGRIRSRESEGLGMGQNDLFCRIKLFEDGKSRYDKRHPSDGSWSGNVKEVNFTIPHTIMPTDPGKVVSFQVNVKESDNGADDALGNYSVTLNAANAWGMRRTGGVFDSGSFAKIRSITASLIPQVSVSNLSELDKFWSLDNESTDEIPWQLYAAAFRDVDTDTEALDPGDWMDQLFYKLWVKKLAEEGNCFGMSLEAIYARKGRSLFGMPISRFKTWEVLRKEFNIRHCYQVGVESVMWFATNYMLGTWCSPKDVFRMSQEAFSEGNHPVLCLAQNADFSGAPHAVLPVSWDSTAKPWKIAICDPSNPGTVGTLFVDPDRNSFSYEGANRYEGSAAAGGHMYHFPYWLLDTRQKRPGLKDLAALGVVASILMVGSAETAGILDSDGNNLDAGDGRAPAPKAGPPKESRFVRVRPIDGKSSRAPAPRGQPQNSGELWMRAVPMSSSSLGVSALDVLHQPLDSLLQDPRLSALSTAIKSSLMAGRAVSGRSIAHVLNDPAALRLLPADAIAQLRTVTRSASGQDFVHSLRATGAGVLSYAVMHGLTAVQFSTTANAGERISVHSVALGSSRSSFNIESAVGRAFSIEVVHQIGMTGDYVRTRVENVIAGSTTPLHVNPRPGLGGIDLVTGARQPDISVMVDVLREGKLVKSQSTVAFDGGVRLNLDRVLRGGTGAALRIDRLFGGGIR